MHWNWGGHMQKHNPYVLCAVNSKLLWITASLHHTLCSFNSRCCNNSHNVRKNRYILHYRLHFVVFSPCCPCSSGGKKPALWVSSSSLCSACHVPLRACRWRSERERRPLPASRCQDGAGRASGGEIRLKKGGREMTGRAERGIETFIYCLYL